jgi:hypothetical protein
MVGKKGQIKLASKNKKGSFSEIYMQLLMCVVLGVLRSGFAVFMHH